MFRPLRGMPATAAFHVNGPGPALCASSHPWMELWSSATDLYVLPGEAHYGTARSPDHEGVSIVAARSRPTPTIRNGVRISWESRSRYDLAASGSAS